MTVKKKKCKCCGELFQPRDNYDRKVRKYCGRDCYDKARRDTRRVKVCKQCQEKFEVHPHRVSAKFCSQPCNWAYSKKSRIGDGNPNYRSGLWSKNGLYKNSRWGSSKAANKHSHACAKYRKKFLEVNNYLRCEVCNIVSAFKFDVHHIYYASKYPYHPQLHNPLNLVLVCRECHNKFHANKMKEAFEALEKERGLKNLFAKKT